MSELPRVLAVTTDAICRMPDFESRLAALGALGPEVGVVVRAPGSTAAEQAGFATAAARQMTAGLFVHARPDLAAALDARGVQLRAADLSPRDARRVFPQGLIGVSIHDRAEAERTIAEGADFLVAGNVFASTSHPGRPGRGLDWLREIAGLGCPVLAIGGITPERVGEVRDAGAWGVAAIAAIWDAPDPGSAAAALRAGFDRGTDLVSLTVNGEAMRVKGPATLAGLLEELGLDPRSVVVELNRRIVRRPALAGTPLQPGDVVELVHFVGGG
jgi:thiamine biosynthesis protein ThiS